MPSYARFVQFSDRRFAKQVVPLCERVREACTVVVVDATVRRRRRGRRRDGRGAVPLPGYQGRSLRGRAAVDEPQEVERRRRWRGVPARRARIFGGQLRGFVRELVRGGGFAVFVYVANVGEGPRPGVATGAS